MAEPTGENSSPGGATFADQAEQPRSGLVREFWDFLKHNKKWWLTPIIAMLLLLGTLLLLGGTATAPFIYTLF